MANHYDLLGIAKTASTAEVRKAYAKLARERHPDRFPDPEAKKRAQQSFQDITAAFNTLSNDRNRAEYDQGLAAPARAPIPHEIAAEAFDRGVKLFEAKSFFEAVELLRVSVAHAPQEARYHAALGRALARNPHWVREGIQTLEKASQLAPRHAGYHAELAEILASQGLRIRARKEAEAALRLDANHAAARRVMDSVADEDPPPSDGGIGGIRGLLRRKS